MHVDFQGWRITTGADYTFPSGTSLAAGGYLVITADPAAFATATGVTALGPWKSGAKLSNNGEDITLCNASGTVVDVVARRNVVRVVEQLHKDSRTIEGLIREGQIAIVGAMYDVVTGDIEFLPDDVRADRQMRQTL